MTCSSTRKKMPYVLLGGGLRNFSVLVLLKERIQWKPGRVKAAGVFCLTKWKENGSRDRSGLPLRVGSHWLGLHGAFYEVHLFSSLPCIILAPSAPLVSPPSASVHVCGHRFSQELQETPRGAHTTVCMRCVGITTASGSSGQGRPQGHML